MKKKKPFRKDYYPGKPGPAPTGLSRKIHFPFMLNEDEFEYLRRIEKSTFVKKASFIRTRAFRPGWKGALIRLRRLQGANV